MKNKKIKLTKIFYDVWNSLDSLTPEEFDELILVILLGHLDESDDVRNNSFGDSNNRKRFEKFFDRTNLTYKRMCEELGLLGKNEWYGERKIEGLRSLLELVIDNDLDYLEDQIMKDMTESLIDKLGDENEQMEGIREMIEVLRNKNK